MTLTRTRRGRGAVGLSTVALVVSALLIAIPSPSSAAVLKCDGKVVTLAGTPGNDVLVGTSGDDVISGLGGNDVIKGLSGADTLCGGRGHDEILGGRQNDRIFGGPGADYLVGGPGADRVVGGNGPDDIRGGSGDDRLFGGDGVDRLTGMDGNDYIEGNAGKDTLVGGEQVDDLFGGGGTDRCAGDNETSCERNPYDFAFKRFLINQAVPAADSKQNPSKRVPTVEKRGGIVRAFITGNRANIASPTVHLYWKVDGVVDKALMTGPATLPQVALESDLSSTFNYEFDETLLTPNAEMYVVVDRNDKTLETHETNNRYPASGWADIDTKDVPRLKITVVPIDGVTLSQTQAEALFDKTFRVHPVGDWDINVRAPYVCQGCSSPIDGTDFQILLTEIRDMYLDGNRNRMYHAIVPQSWAVESGGIGGIGYVGGWPAAVSGPYPETIAHETGHNMSLLHNECNGFEADPDPDFPYTGGWIGKWGYDPGNGTTYDPTVYKDLMTYCSPEWTSDFSYGKVLDWRSSGGFDVLAAPLTAPGTGTVMEFTGTVPADTPAVSSFELTPEAKRVAGVGKSEIARIREVDYAPAMPAPGEHTLVGVAASGEQVVSLSFKAYAFDHAPGASFAFAIELSDETLSQVVQWEVKRAGEVIASRAAGQ